MRRRTDAKKKTKKMKEVRGENASVTSLSQSSPPVGTSNDSRGGGKGGVKSANLAAAKRRKEGEKKR